MRSDSGWEKWRSCLGFEGGEEEGKKERKKEDDVMSCISLSLSPSLSSHVCTCEYTSTCHIGVCFRSLLDWRCTSQEF